MAKQYTKGFKNKHIKEALRATASQEISLVGYSKKHGIPHTTLHQWVTKHKKDDFTLKKEQAFIELKNSTQICDHIEPVVITTSFCSLTLPTSISQSDLIKFMKSLKEASVCF